jgi:hypothetical protein
MIRLRVLLLGAILILPVRAQDPPKPVDVADADVETDADRVPATRRAERLPKGARLLTAPPERSGGRSSSARQDRLVGKDVAAPAGVITIDVRV